MQSSDVGGTVIALAGKRRAARSDGRRRSAARVVVALWLGVGVLGVILLLGQAAVLVLHHGVAGLGIGLIALTALAWPLAGRWIRYAADEPSHKQPISSKSGARPLKGTLRSAEALKRDS
jgi:hypothetical protein